MGPVQDSTDPLEVDSGDFLDSGERRWDEVLLHFALAMA